MQNKISCPKLKSTEIESKPFVTSKGGAYHHVHVERTAEFESCPDKVILEYRKRGSNDEWKTGYMLNKLKETYCDERLDNRVRLVSDDEYRIIVDRPGVEVWIDTGGLQGNISDLISTT